MRPPEGCCARFQTALRNESFNRSGNRRKAGLSSSNQARPLIMSRASGKLMCFASGASSRAAALSRLPEAKHPTQIMRIRQLGIFIFNLRWKRNTGAEADTHNKIITPKLLTMGRFHFMRCQPIQTLGVSSMGHWLTFCKPLCSGPADSGQLNDARGPSPQHLNDRIAVRRESALTGFTLIELLVVIAIIAIL